MDDPLLVFALAGCWLCLASCVAYFAIDFFSRLKRRNRP